LSMICSRSLLRLVDRAGRRWTKTDPPGASRSARFLTALLSSSEHTGPPARRSAAEATCCDLGGPTAHGALVGAAAEDVPAAQGEQGGVGERGDRRGARDVAEQPDLAEHLTRAVGAQHDPVVGDLHLAGLDDVEPVGDPTLFEDDLAGARGDG